MHDLAFADALLQPYLAGLWQVEEAYRLLEELNDLLGSEMGTGWGVKRTLL